MVIAQFLGVKLLNNTVNFPREQCKEIGAWEGLKLDKYWPNFVSQEGGWTILVQGVVRLEKTLYFFYIL